jgi:hypothetical protein
VATHHGRLDPYGIELHLATSVKSWRQLRRDLPELTAPKNPGGGGATVWTADRRQPIDVGHCLVFINVKSYRRRGGNDLAETCAHEAAHVVLFLFDHINTDPVHAHEPFAYMVGWVTTWLMERVR